MKSSLPYILFTLPFHDTQKAMQMSFHTVSVPSMSLGYFSNVVDSLLQNPVSGRLCA